MATSNGISYSLPLPGNQSTSSTSGSGPVYAMTLGDKLFALGRAQYLSYFEELRKQEIVTPYLQVACTWLVQDAFSATKRDHATRLIACVLWPGASWSLTKDQLFMYLSMPNTSNISQRALIRVNRPAKSPDSKVTLFGQHGRQDFDLRDLSQLYKLFEAVVDSEIAWIQESMQCLLASSLLMNMPSICRQDEPSPTFITRWMWYYLYADLPMAEQRWLFDQNCHVQLPTLVRTIRDRTFDDKDTKEASHKRSEEPLGRNALTKRHYQPRDPSNLRYELLQREELPFHFITWPKIGSVASPNDLAESLALQDFITVDGEPRSDYDELLLFVSINWAALRLREEGMAPLAEELKRLRVLLSRSRRGADPPFGPTSRQLTNEVVGQDDRIHIICCNCVSDKIKIWMIDAGQGRKRWVVRIEKRT
ncbi:hypothetical protein AA0112_g1966 [Alternaria arborescens]|nr:hypothetical protein AA0112_g1966 [Alternaria arborescens]